LNGIFPYFDLFSSKFSPTDKLIDIFPSYFSFHSMNRKYKESKKVYIHELNKIIFQVVMDSKSVVVVSDASIKNQVTILIAYVHTHDSSVIKTIYHAINITLTEAKLFTIRCSINQATQISKID